MTRKLVVFRGKKGVEYTEHHWAIGTYMVPFFVFLKLESEIRKDIKDKRK